MSSRVLNLQPMIRALAFAPSDFTRLDNGDVRHVPSMHDVHINWHGRTSIRMDDTVVRHQCSCVAESVVKRVSLVTTWQQRRELKAAVKGWIVNYWEPKLNLEAQKINEHFEGHFDPLSAHFRGEHDEVKADEARTPVPAE